jgi:hypothetical protein
VTYKREKRGEKQGAEESNPRARARADVVAAICERVRGGTHVSHACALEGIAKSTLHEWRKEPEIEIAVEAARAEAAESRRLQLERIAGGEHPTVSADDKTFAPPNPNVLLALLARSHPDEYGQEKQRVEQTGADGAPLAVQFYVPRNPRIPSGE